MCGLYPPELVQSDFFKIHIKKELLKSAHSQKDAPVWKKCVKSVPNPTSDFDDLLGILQFYSGIVHPMYEA